MRDVNLIKDKIRKELEKGLPSKRKILSYLLDLLKKDKYPSLSDIEFYDIVGETYRLNLDYKLNLEMLFFPVYNALKKMIKKLYGDEKRLEMEQYLIKNFGLFAPEQILNKIKEEFEQSNLNDLNSREFLSLKISAIFSDLLSKEEYQHISSSDFNFIVGETFNLDPELFMNSLNRDLRIRMVEKNRLELDKYMFEKFVLLKEEHIIFESYGDIEFVDWQLVKKSGGTKIIRTSSASVLLSSGSIFLTDNRLITQGILDVKVNWTPLRVLTGFESDFISDNERKYQAKQAILESSPIYGYQFPIRNHINLKKSWKGVNYMCIQDNQFKEIKIKLTIKKREEQIDIIFKILSKDVNQIQDTIKVLLEMDLKSKWKSKEIAELLLRLRVAEEYKRLTDSEYTDIVETTYKMNPQFFMTHVYPQIESINHPSIESIKKDLIEHIKNLNNETI